MSNSLIDRLIDTPTTQYWLLIVNPDESGYILLERAETGTGTFSAPDREAALDFCQVCLHISQHTIR